MERIVIVTSCDNKYAPYCGILITSIFENNKDSQVIVNILTDYISDTNKALMQKLSKIYNQFINIINIDKGQFVDLPMPSNAPHINICTYYRLLIPKLFPKEEKVLYLDCDMIVRKSLRELWNTDLTGFAFGGTKDCKAMQRSCERLNYTSKDYYYNAGMQMYNIQFLHQIGYSNIVNDFIKNHFDLIVCHDQDILNACFHGKFKTLSSKWNMMDCYLYNNYQFADYERNDVLQYRKDPSIVHYTGPLKPWFYDTFHTYSKDFKYYMKKSPWNLPIQYRLSSKKYYYLYAKHCIKQILGHCGLPYGIV